MQQICSQCQRAAANNLWCQQPSCPAEQMPPTLRPGDFVNTVEITRLVATLPTTTLYVGQRNGQAVLVKVAPFAQRERLKREAAFLQQHKHPMLLSLLSPEANSRQPYGKTAVSEQTLYYYVCQTANGITLRQLLEQTPQPSIQTVGWLALSIAEVIGFLHHQGVYHLDLNPDSLLVALDNNQVPRIHLLDLGFVTPFKEIVRYWHLTLTPQLYIAPELLARRPISEATEVYGVGLLLHELLNGRSPYPLFNQTEPAAVHLATSSQLLPTLRPDVQELTAVVQQALDPNPANRQPSVLALAQQLSTIFPAVPPQINQTTIRQEWLKLSLALVLALALASAFALLSP